MYSGFAWLDYLADLISRIDVITSNVKIMKNVLAYRLAQNIALIDTHAHLEDIENLDQSLQIARDSGVQAIIAVGTNEQSNFKALEISQKYPSFVYPGMGLHPWDIHNLNEGQIESVLRSIEDNIDNVSAIGEVGLDYDKRVIKLTSKTRQQELFAQLLKLAQKYNKPVSIHSRYAWKDCFALVKESGISKAVFHWFTGFSSVLKDIIDSGYYISANPAAEYHEEHRRSVRETPLPQLLLETDCPVTYGREVKYRSQPSDVVRSLKAAASLKSESEEVIAQKTTENAIAVFNIGLKSTRE